MRMARMIPSSAEVKKVMSSRIFHSFRWVDMGSIFFLVHSQVKRYSRISPAAIGMK